MDRPWWGGPWFWGLVTVLLVLGVFVSPRLFGFTFVLVPLVWIRRRRGPSEPTSPGG